MLDLADDLEIRRPLVMGAHRVELTGFSDGTVPHLKALGLASEIIAWRLRLFVPAAEERGPAILGAILERHPLLRPRPCGADRGNVRDQAAELARRLAREAEAVCRPYLSNGHRQGQYWIVGDIHNTPGRSLYVRLRGPIPAPAPPANGPMPRPVSMAICSI